MSRSTYDTYHTINNKALLFSRTPLSIAIQSTILVGSLISSTSYAEQDSVNNTEALQPIVVTAEKRESDVQDIPSSISVKTAKEIDDAEITSVTELSQHPPNLHIFTWGGRRDTNVFIRGIGPGLFTDPTVGFYVDGVNYSNNGAFDMDFLDIERVEVLRGPQGTLYGGNSLAGVMNITTKKPGNKTEGKVSLTADNLSRQSLSTNINTPLINDKLFLGVSLSSIKDDGHIDNVVLNEDFGERDDITAKAKLRWTPHNKLETLLVIDHENFDGDSYAFGPTTQIRKNPYQINHDFRGVDDRKSFGTSFTVNWKGDIDFTSISSWRDWESLNSSDQDGGNTSGYRSHSTSKEEQKQISQELRWSASNSKLSWIGGLYAYKSQHTTDSVNDVDYTAFGYGGPYTDTSDSVKDNTGYAAFGQIDFFLDDQFTLTTGLRLDKEKREASVNQNSQTEGIVGSFNRSKSFNEFLPKVALSYTTENDNLVYGSVSRGYRAGGFDTLYPDLNNTDYDSETSTNYELGFKSLLLEDRLEFNTAFFWIDINDQQVQQLAPNTTRVITDNAAKSYSRGVEFETRFTPSKGWLLGFSSSYTDTKFEDYIGITPDTSTAEDYTGNHLPNAPRLTTNLSIQNRQPISNSLTWFTQVDNNYIGSHFFDAQNNLEQGSYKLVNVKMGVEAKDWSVYLLAKNALDEYYSSTEFSFGTPTAEAGDPRSVGITFNAKL